MKLLYFLGSLRRLGLLGSLLLGVGLAQAQTPGSGGPAPTDPVSPTEVPLDGGASLLLAAGVGLGLRRLRRRRAAAK